MARAKMHVVAYYIVSNTTRGTIIHGTLQRPGQPVRPWEAIESHPEPGGYVIIGDFTPAEQFQIIKMALWAAQMKNLDNGRKSGAVYFVN